MNGTDTNLMQRLADPFPVEDVHFKAQTVKGSRALAVAYLDARAIEDRLDAVFGIEGWQDAYQVLPNGSVICTLKVRVGSAWIERHDVGSPSEQPDEGDRVKAAFSDALKRAAVKFGIGRYLYRLPKQWVDYDPQNRQLKNPPKLPAWALPGGKGAPGSVEKKAAAISREQWETIKAELTKHGTSQRLFLTAFGVQKPGQLPAAQYETALKVATAGESELQKRINESKKVGVA